MPEPKTNLVFDIHIYVDNLVGPESSWPRIQELRPSTRNASADCVSIMFYDGPRDYALFASPHIIHNATRILRDAGLSADLINGHINDLLEVISETGGAVVEPATNRDRGIGDFEDNQILNLAAAVDALLIISDDTDLTPLSPWNGRLILGPHEFVRRHVSANRRRR
ncbi:hypothetical protein ACFOYW_06240 [Gryllotalpicola reticulitermitis]|uniref:PIN domain-containing protein n=1 Tax=Gryllotalpicola reticulitermitis TaxID=1184153 RepID=A0ABV8Q739_9MICO